MKIQLLKTILVLLFIISIFQQGITQCYTANANNWNESWKSCQTSLSPNSTRGVGHWLHFEFQQAEFISDSWIWNANAAGESLNGVKDVIIDYSTDGTTWIQLGTYTFPKANETSNYQGFQGPDFGGLLIKEILITVVSTYINSSCASLSEVQFNIDTDACHGVVDACGECNGPGPSVWYVDVDGDGLGSPYVFIIRCNHPSGFVSNNLDDCDNYNTGWDIAHALFMSNGCVGCHGGGNSFGGFNVDTYDDFLQGGNKCGTAITTGNTLISIITEDGYAECGTPIGTAMNTRVGGSVDAEELALLQAWIDIGAPENCNCPAGSPDVDGDGVCDKIDDCPNFDNTIIGTSCDDQDPCTFDDIWTTTCECKGQAAEDTDADGICDSQDVAPENPCTADGSIDGSEPAGFLFQASNDCDGDEITNADGDQDDFDACIIDTGLSNNAECQCPNDIAWAGGVVVVEESNMNTPHLASGIPDGVFSDLMRFDRYMTFEYPYMDANTEICFVVTYPKRDGKTTERIGFEVNYYNYTVPNPDPSLPSNEPQTVCIKTLVSGPQKVKIYGVNYDYVTVDGSYFSYCACTVSDPLYNASNANAVACSVGAACDDGDPCTVNDVYDCDCNCAGQDVPLPTGYYFDFGPDKSYINSIGWTNLSSSNSSSPYYSWENPSAIQSGETDNIDLDFKKDYIYSYQSNTFEAEVENGKWTGYGYFGTYERSMDSIQFVVEDQYASVFSRDSAAFIARAFTVEVHDGKLTFDVGSIGGDDDYWAMYALRMTKVDPRTEDCTEGQPCDDGLSCTTNDVYDCNCNCLGTYIDSDNDGDCDAKDVTIGACNFGEPCYNSGDGCVSYYDENCDCIEMVNHALDGEVSFSSQYNSAIPQRLNDGDLNTYLGHTSNTSDYEWVDIDLLENKNIGNIAIWNRQSCCGNRINNVYVFIADTPFPNNTDLNTSFANADNIYQLSNDRDNDAVIVIPANVSGRYIRLQKSGDNPGGGYLNIHEIQVFGPATNIADSDSDGIPDTCDECPNMSDMISSDNDGDGNPDYCEGCEVIDFNKRNILSAAGTSQDYGNSYIQDNGISLKLDSNSWKAIIINREITPNTVIEFDFKSNVEGELQGIGFSSDLYNINSSTNPSTWMLVHGTETNDYDILGGDDYTDIGNWQTLTSPIGDFISGRFTYLYFINDDDNASNGISDAYFRNIKIYEDIDGDALCDVPCTLGQSIDQICYDADPCTVNGAYDASCNCASTSLDLDNDGICHFYDTCPGGDDALDSDNDGVCDYWDVCPGSDDLKDYDGDGIPDGCDNECKCPTTDVVTRFTVKSGHNDIEQLANGRINFGSGDLDIIADSDNLTAPFTIGLRYQDMHIPDNAIITDARLQFSADEVSTAAASIEIHLENTLQAKAFSHGVHKLTDRNYINNSVNWAAVPTWNTVDEAGPDQLSPDFSSLLNQLLTAQTAADERFSIAIMLTGSGVRTANSFDGDNKGVELVISYSVNCEDNDGDATPDTCDICPQFNDSLIGTSCDDSDPCTNDDTYSTNCNCVGILQDTNNNGICDLDECVDIQLNTYLEGAYDSASSEMTTQLHTRGLLPGQTPASNLATATPAGQPYSIVPWNYIGTEGANWTDTDYTGNETDWILISFRTGTAKSTEVAMTAGLLMKGGSIELPNRCVLTSDMANSLYIVLEHRNHIGIMTPQPINVINNTLTYDFRSSDSYRDATSFGQKQSPTGEWTMYAGDASQLDFPSFDINGTDKTLWFDNNGIFDYYFSPDFNLDGDINGQDKSLWFDNNGISSRVPK